MRDGTVPSRRATVRRGRAGVAAAAVTLAAATGLSLAGVEPFPTWHYHLAWYPTLLLLAAGLAWRTGRWPVPERAGWAFAVSLLFWSVPTWYFFELLNLRMANWYYVFLVPSRPLRWAGTFAAFATVLPALYLGYRWARSAGVGRGWSRPRFRVGTLHRVALLASGGAFLALALWRPKAFYPLIWGALTLVLEPWNHHRNPRTSLVGDLSRGRYDRIVQLLVGGLFIGLLWELYNAGAEARWIYTVPGLERVKLFEMPVPGFLGFPVLALDAFVVYQALVNAGVALPGWEADGDGAPEGPGGRAETATAPAGERRPRPGRTVVAALAALLFSGAVQTAVDRWTVDSWSPEMADLPVAGTTLARLGPAGVESVADLAARDSSALAREAGLEPREAGAAVRAARLASLRGLGTENAAVLWRAGIRSLCDLAGTPASRLAGLVKSGRSGPRAGYPPRVRVWRRAARERCAETGRRR